MTFQTHVQPPNIWTGARRANAVQDWIASTAPPPFAAGPESVRTPPTSFCSTPSSAYADENFFARPDTASRGVDDGLPPMPLYPSAQDVEANNYAPCRTATAGSMASRPPLGQSVWQGPSLHTPSRLAEPNYLSDSATPATFAAEGRPERQPLQPKLDEEPLLWGSSSAYGEEGPVFHSAHPTAPHMQARPLSIYHQQGEALHEDTISFGSPLTFAESRAGDDLYRASAFAGMGGRSVYEGPRRFRPASEPQGWQAFQRDPQEQRGPRQANVWASQM